MSATAADAELLFKPVTELAGMVRSGELGARELVAASLARIEELDGRVNAFVDVDADGALAAADAIAPGDARPFAGVPIAIKNNRAVGGMRLTHATALLADDVADDDCALVARLRAAGFVVVGTTALPELGILPVCESQLLGPTRNPWDLERTPGGSSGGAGAAVAAGMVPIAHGNDGGGSIRIPAACCGLVGLKPQRGRVSPAPEGDSFLVVDGVLTRTVGDSAAVLDVMAGYETGDPTWAPPPRRRFAEATAPAAHPGPLRIAQITASPLPDVTVSDEALGAVHRAAALLGELGHDVREVPAPWTGDPELLALFTVEFAIAVSAAIAVGETLAGRPATEQDMEPLSWTIVQLARSANAVDALIAHRRLQATARTMLTELDPYDVLLLPMLAEPPVPIGEIDSTAPEPMATFARSGRFTPFTALFNVTGQPAISLPLYESAAGLPLAVQLAGRPAGEDTLLALAAQLERECPWAGRRAPL